MLDELEKSKAIQCDRRLLDAADSDEARGNDRNTCTCTRNLKKFRRSVYQYTSLSLTFIEEILVAVLSAESKNPYLENTRDH